METVVAKTETSGQSTAGSEGILERIRLRTRDVHESLEALPIWGAAFSSVEAYASLLDGFLSLVRPTDAAIGRMLGSSAPDGFLATMRSDWLESDRHAIARRMKDPTEIHPVADDVLVGGIAASSRPAAAGTLYVIEGSALGGRVIARRLQESLGIQPESGSRYFSGHGSDTGMHWRRFLAWLDGMQLDPSGAEEAASAARSVFERFRERLATLRHD